MRPAGDGGTAQQPLPTGWERAGGRAGVGSGGDRGRLTSPPCPGVKEAALPGPGFEFATLERESTERERARKDFETWIQEVTRAEGAQPLSAVRPPPGGEGDQRRGRHNRRSGIAKRGQASGYDKIYLDQRVMRCPATEVAKNTPK